MKIDKAKDTAQDKIDAVLLRKSLDGDDDAFGELWEHYRALLAASTFRKIKRLGTIGQIPEQVDDIVNETFLAAWKGISKITPGRAFRPWLWGVLNNITKNHIKLHTRPAGPHAFNPHSLIDVLADPEQNIKENREAICVSISKIDNETYRTCLDCYFLQGMRQVDVAEFFGIDRNTAAIWIKGAVEALRLQMESEGFRLEDFYDRH